MQHFLIFFCLTTQTLCISWISEMQQEAVKHLKTQHAHKNVSTRLCFTVWGVSKCSVGGKFSQSSFAWSLVFFLSWMTKFSLYCCLAHTHLQLLNHRKILQKWGNVDAINKLSACRTDVFLWGQLWFINTDQFRSMFRAVFSLWIFTTCRSVCCRAVTVWACCCSLICLPVPVCPALYSRDRKWPEWFC